MKGTYVKDGNITEVYIGNGVTELLPEKNDTGPYLGIQAFTFYPRQVKKKSLHKRHLRLIRWFSILCSAFCPISILMLLADRIHSSSVFMCFCAVTSAWAVYVIAANLGGRNEDH